jgi:2-polyprenyl-3-methyl-5-hydroxy-6-metoxy-1,4-benzoquinol methylase
VTELDPCDVCGATGGMRPLLRVSLSGVRSAEVHRCAACGFRQVRPRLTRDDLARLYPSDYFDPGSPLGFRGYALQQQRAEREAYFLARSIRGTGPAGRLLEVGCALGFMLEALGRFTGWAIQGLDVSPFAAWFARRRYGLSVTCSTLEEAGFPAGTFDVVVQKDVVEHVLSPREHLRETCRILRPGGTVFVNVPNGSANLAPLLRVAARLARRPEGEALPLLDQGHLSFFGRGHFVRLASECGLSTVAFRTTDVTGGLRALGWLPGKRRKLEKTAPAAPPATPAAAGPAGDEDPARRERLYEDLCRDLDRARSRLRSWPPYFYFRHGLKAVNSLPGPFACGNNFFFVLRKP